jgi:hypothetical protein
MSASNAMSSHGRVSSITAPFALLSFIVVLVLVPSLAQGKSCVYVNEATSLVERSLSDVCGSGIGDKLKKCLEKKAHKVNSELHQRQGECCKVTVLGEEVGTMYGHCGHESNDQKSKIVSIERNQGTEAMAASSVKSDGAMVGISARGQCSGRCGYCCWLAASFGYAAAQSCFWTCA